LSKSQDKNFVTLHKEIFVKKKNKFGKNRFYNEQKQIITSLHHYIDSAGGVTHQHHNSDTCSEDVAATLDQ
jgi:hypothetical protein